MAVLIKQFPNISVEIFTLFLVWLSTGDLNNAKNFTLSPGSAFDLEDSSQKLSQLIRCYHLSEDLITRPFQNYIADQICDYLDYLVDKEGLLEKTIIRNIPLIYADVLKETRLKCLFEDAIVTYGFGFLEWSGRRSDSKDQRTGGGTYAVSVELGVREYVQVS
ncbi:hypothetical protein V491_02448 [Pseudogymnoascus sp. VKM F-3775]|nr:hypothetical protein V491_02448 [Pseudogymnoascus sp. VKM F-3775]